MDPATSTLPSLPTLTDRASSELAVPNWRVHSSGTHVRSIIDEPASPSTYPVPHTCHGVQAVWLGSVEYSPAGHIVQARLTAALPTVLTYVPAAHTVHGVQLGAFIAVL
ncbi:MAG: hypothetical protein IPG81_16985 [Sandaracinaceae bacterium]|nr:hypothetical protein [Sandaracinaceae bacterium]